MTSRFSSSTSASGPAIGTNLCRYLGTIADSHVWAVIILRIFEAQLLEGRNLNNVHLITAVVVDHWNMAESYSSPSLTLLNSGELTRFIDFIDATNYNVALTFLLHVGKVGSTVNLSRHRGLLVELHGQT